MRRIISITCLQIAGFCVVVAATMAFVGDNKDNAGRVLLAGFGIGLLYFPLRPKAPPKKRYRGTTSGEPVSGQTTGSWVAVCPSCDAPYGPSNTPCFNCGGWLWY